MTVFLYLFNISSFTTERLLAVLFLDVIMFKGSLNKNISYYQEFMKITIQN